MTAYEYLNALREALEVLPDDERANAMRYYEEYFLDAGPENEQHVIEELGAPAQVAQQILNDYKEVVRAAPRASETPEEGPLHAEEAETPPRGFQQSGSFVPPKRSLLTNILLFCGALMAGVCIGVPLLATAAGLVVTVAAAGLAVVAGLLIAAAALLVVLPVGMAAAGVVLCVFSLFLWGSPASAVATLGAGLCILSLGGLLCAGCLRLCTMLFRPLLRTGGWCVEQCGVFFRWCVDVVRRFLDRLREV